VDQGVVKHMEPQLKKQDWDLIIGHFLGVDHCGHRYGPDHPEMTRKLTEMDGFVRYGNFNKLLRVFSIT